MDKAKLKKTIQSDIWVFLLDIISVNLAYYLALVIRFFVGGKFYTSLRELPYIYSHFAPFYTIICLIVFFAFRLYGGMWRYAGIYDINRIIGASAVTTAFQVVGTLIFVKRMPLTFYFIGASLQFFFITITRFAYRFVVIEKRKLGKKEANAMIIGAGDSARYTIGLLDEGITYRPSCVIDSHFSGRFMDGLPVYGLDDIEEAIDKHSITCVVIAENNIQTEERDKIKELCAKRGITLRDYTSYFDFVGENEEVAVVTQAKAAGKNIIPFSPPDISDAEIGEVDEALRSGWITTGPRTKLLERRLAAYIGTGKTDVDTEADADRWNSRVVCLNSATAAEELNLRVLGVGPGDEVIVPAYTYTASASAAIHCGAKIVFVDIQKDGDKITHCPEMDYEKLENAITEKTKAIVVVDLGGIVADYEKVFTIVERKKNLFKPLESDGTPLGDLNSRIQKAIGRVAVLSDCAHGLGASRIINGERKYTRAIADFSSFSFHAVNVFQPVRKAA